MSQFDSRVAMVGLGRSEVQVLRLGQTRGGTYSVNPGTGWVRINHTNYAGKNKTETIVKIPNLGEVVYRNGGTVIAYQGGGVWRMEDGGGATMISPPEFHYRASTLTLPILNITGSGSVSGSTTAVLKQTGPHHRVFPNSSATYNEGKKYLNPIGKGTVNITVKSDYYRAWEEYFRTRTDGKVSVFPERQIVKIQLIALATEGDFTMPLEGNSVNFRGLTTHQIRNFTITLFDDGGDKAEFSNLKWSLYADEGSKQFEIHVEDTSGSAKHGDPARVTIYYSNNSGNTYQTWTNDSAFTYETENKTGKDFDGDGIEEGDKRLVIDLTSDAEFTYKKQKVMVFSTSGNFDEKIRFEGHPNYDTGKQFTQSSRNIINNTTNHYLALMGPSVSLVVDDKESNTINERISSGTIEYGGQSDLFLTYLHVTENRVNVTLR
ncbi:MAG: hypothetical protein ABEI52_01640 [Halobacteriaceae archaeon]